MSDGGPAFPRSGAMDVTQGSGMDGDCFTGAQPGMSLRDYFAAAALHHLTMDVVDRIAAPDEPEHDEVDDEGKLVVPPEALARRLAMVAYLVADAMLKSSKA